MFCSDTSAESPVNLPAYRGFPDHFPLQAHSLRENLKTTYLKLKETENKQMRMTDFVPNEDEKKEDKRDLSTEKLLKTVTPRVRVRLVVRGTGCAWARLEVVSVVRPW